MDSSSSWEKAPAPGRPAAPSYREIGETLLAAEALFLAVGVPWLLPTAAVRERVRRSGFSDQVITPSEFFKVTLANVPTPALESYLEDLAALPLNDHGAKALGIDGVRAAERCALPIIVFVGCFSLVYFGSIVSRLESSVAYGFSGVGAAMSALLTLPSCLERNRRRSFQWNLNEELMRRHGVLGTGPGTVIPLRADPLAGAD